MASIINITIHIPSLILGMAIVVLIHILIDYFKLQANKRKKIPLDLNPDEE